MATSTCRHKRATNEDSDNSDSDVPATRDPKGKKYPYTPQRQDEKARQEVKIVNLENGAPWPDAGPSHRRGYRLISKKSTATDVSDVMTKAAIGHPRKSERKLALAAVVTKLAYLTWQRLRAIVNANMDENESLTRH